MGRTNKIVNGVIWSIIYNVVNAIYGFISIPILLNYFGKSQYGLIGIAMSVNVYMQLMDMGFNSTNVRFFSSWLAQHNFSKVKSGFQVSLTFYGIVGLINALILIVVAFFSNCLFNITSEQVVVIKHLFLILALSAIVSWYSSSFDQLICSTENVAWIKKRSILPKLLQVIVLVATIFFKLKLEAYFFLTVMAFVLILPLSISKIKKELPYISFFPKWNTKIFKEILPYSFNIFSFSIFQFSFYQLRPVFLGMRGTPEMVADYRVMEGIIGIIVMISGAFLGVLLPSASKVVAQNDKTAYNRIAYDATKYITIIICMLCFGLILIGPNLITIYVGKEYLYLLPWFNLWIVCMLSSHNQAISSLILSGSDIRPLTFISIIASVCGLIATWLLIPKYGVGGTVLGLILYISIQMIFNYLYYWPRKLNINSKYVFFKVVFPYILIGFMCYLICNYIPHEKTNLVNIIYLGFSFFFMYVLLSFFTLTSKDKQFIISILKRK
jgi:O-antigen/teichoic acid export membrane protein